MVDYLGFLSEDAATNNALYARDFTQADWVKSNLTAALDAAGADGGASSASTLTATSNNGTALQAVTLSADDYTYSVFVKRKTGAGVIEITDDGGSNYTEITDLINTTDFTRVQITRSQANPDVGFRIGASGDEIIVDFAQLEPGIFATSPIATTTVAVTRAIDNANASIDNKPWFNPVQGTILVNFKRIEGMEDASVAMQLDDGTDNNAIRIGQDSTANDRQFFASVVNGGSEDVSLTVIESTFNNRGVCAFAFTEDDFSFCVNGGEVQTASSGTLPTGLINARIGRATSNALQGTVISSRYYNTRLTDDEIIALTVNQVEQFLIQEGEIVDASVEYTRDSAATYYDVDGLLAYASANEQRKHYFPDGSGDYGLLLEGERENIVPYSSLNSTGYGVGGAATRTANAVTSPDGTTNATQLDYTASTTDGIFINPAPSVTEVPHTFSVFIKHLSGSQTNVFFGATNALTWGSTSAFLVSFNAATGTVVSTGAAVDETVVEELPDGWYRLSMTGTPSSAGNSTFLIYNSSVLAGSFAVFGAQVEAANFPSTLIETTGAAATRVADQALVNKISLRDWFNALEGTLFVDFRRFDPTDVMSYAMQIDDQTSDNRIFVGQQNDAGFKITASSIFDGGSEEFLSGISTGDQNLRLRLALGYDENNSRFAANGFLGVADDDCSIPNGLLDLKLGYSTESDGELFGVLRAAGFINYRLSDVQLIITTIIPS